MKSAILEFKNLVTEFSSEGNKLKAVDDVSFTLNQGETIGIVGESGSGKSVTSLSAMRLIPNPPGKISGGEIIFHKNGGGTTNLLKIFQTSPCSTISPLYITTTLSASSAITPKSCVIKRIPISFSF